MKIKPIKDLRNTNEISNECHEYDEPIFITKNGYEDLVLMSNEYFDKILPASVKTKDVGQYINTYCKKDCVNNSFLKVALANPTLKVCDVDYNKEIIKNKIFEAANHGASLIIFPELSLTSYTCRDIFFQKSLINRVESSLKEIVEFTANKSILVLLTTPLFIDNNLIDAVVAIENGTILSIVPKKHYKGIDERAFSNYVKPTKQIELYNDKPLIGNDIILVSNYDKRIKIGIILGDDINDICSSYCNLIKGGANIIINPAADKMIVEDIENKKSFIKGLSSSSSIAIITQSAGKGESTTDYVLSGLNLICECGQTLLDKDIISSKEIEYTDIDIELVSNKCAEKDFSNEINYIGFDTKPEFNELDRKYSAFPFLFDKEAKERYMSIIKTQALGLIKRLDASYSQKLVVALSGGLDSTLALLVAVEAFKMSNRNLKDIIAITIPCFGTSTRTHDNALTLANILGVTFKEINIKESVLKHFEDIEHDPNNFNATYENAQARERTQVAMDYANDVGGLMLGTGDLSELCLGWATYSGDHMSMYGVNASIPKTLVQALTKTYGIVFPETKDVLEDIIGTPISPELLPLKDGEIAQKTEEKVGPYELIDFFIYHLLVNHFSLEKISKIALKAFENKYDKETINHWLASFIKRFHASQFKRSCLPDGPQVTKASVSPRNGLYMPSDSSNSSILKDLK